VLGWAGVHGDIPKRKLWSADLSWPSVADDWFRSSDWSGDAQEEFERRLSRAGASSRPQYLRIKALALIQHGARRGRS